MTAAATDILFRPLSVGTMSLPNRIVMAPMTRGAGTPGHPRGRHAAGR